MISEGRQRSSNTEGVVLYGESSFPGHSAAFLYSFWGGTHWEGEEMQDRAVELLGPDKHRATLAEKHCQGEPWTLLYPLSNSLQTTLTISPSVLSVQVCDCVYFHSHTFTLCTGFPKTLFQPVLKPAPSSPCSIP